MSAATKMLQNSYIYIERLEKCYQTLQFKIGANLELILEEKNRYFHHNEEIFFTRLK